MKKILQLAILGALGIGVSYAAPCAASNLGTYTAGGFSCEMDFSGTWRITFNNFSWVSATAASSIDINPAQNVGIGLGGFSLVQNGSSSFTSSFVFGYTATASCLVGGLDCNLRGYAEQGFFPDNSGAPQITITEGQGPSPVVLTFLAQTSVQPNVFLASSTVKSASYNGGATLQSFESDVFGFATPQQVVPEPTTLSLIGVGLLGLGMTARRRFKR